MTLKDQITQAVVISNEKEDGITLTWESEPHSLVKFSSFNKRSNKQIEGKLVATDNRLVAFISSTSYTEQYARRKFRSDLKNLNISATNLLFEPAVPFTLTNLSSNDVVTTKLFIGQLQVGAHVTLDDDTDYFAVNSDVINCSGQPLRQAFTAEFIEQFDRRCGSNSFPALTYTKFRLINILPA